VYVADSDCSRDASIEPTTLTAAAAVTRMRTHDQRSDSLGLLSDAKTDPHCRSSRLGCQIIAADELDGLRVALPPATRNFAVDGFKPKPH